ncbi:MAG: protein translocase subunit SecD [Bosea sp. (in: a-proteobacteria)]
MMRISRIKSILILLATFIGCLLAVPSLMPEATRKAVFSVLPSWMPQKAVSLGLDLQGGAHVLLEIDKPDLIRSMTTQLRDDVRRVLREERVALQGGIAIQPRGVQFRIAQADDRARAMPKLRALAQPVGQQLFGPTGNQSIDIIETADGQITMAYSELGLNERIRRVGQQTIEVIERRINIDGTKEPSIQRQGLDRVLVQVPGLTDPQQLKERLGRTAKLQFRFVAEAGAAETELMRNRDSGQQVAVDRSVIVEGEDLIDAAASFDSRTGQPIVNFRFNIRGAQRFGDATTRGVGRQLAIVLDNEVISAPVVQTPITGGSGQISGQFTVEQVNSLSLLLRAGALPAKLSIIEERTVGAGLGADSIQAGLLASYLATALVAAFMIVTYGFFGVVAVVAVTFNVLMLLGLLAVVGATLTLPGIAGIVLTVGMAVDANVLIYERVREEARAGRSAISALDAGFERALGTIVDANLTTLIAAIVLFFLGSGPVRGFAVTLSLGILTTVFTAFTLSRLMIATWYRWRRPSKVEI